MFWPLFGSALRLITALGGGWITLRLSGSLTWLFAAIALSLLVYGVTLAAATASGVWFRTPRAARLIASQALALPD